MERPFNKKLKNIFKIANKLKIKKRNLFLYGNHIAKVENVLGNKNGKLILVTAISPTPFGEGKTTLAIGIADALNMLKQNATLALREPSLGPVFGIKGGATGGGESTIEPSNEINLHFTGDMHAITSANNLLASLIDNHIFQGNTLDIQEVLFNRCLDINDRALRSVTLSQGNVCRNEEFVITAASEVMSILSVSKNLTDLKERLGNILVGFNGKGHPVYAKDLKAEEAMTILLSSAIKPNLVQTKIGSPAFVHTGPFANISHGCSSISTIKLALSRSDFVITEAGFGSDLGGEKFLDLICRKAGFNPALTILLLTEKSLIHQGKGNLENGFDNLLRHYNTLTKIFGQRVVCVLNKFNEDKNETKILSLCQTHEIECFSASPFSDGGKGCLSVAKMIIEKCKAPTPQIKFAYPLNKSIKEKTEMIVKKVYGGKGIVLTEKAQKSLEKFEKLAKNFPVIIAKTQYSFSDNNKLLNAPEDFIVTIDDFQLKTGAGFIVAIAGKMMLMPGLPKSPASERMTIDKNGKISW